VSSRIILISNTAWNIYNFRRALIGKLRQNGYEVVAIAPPDEYAARIPETGARYLALAMDNSGTNPWHDLALCLALRRIFQRERPACVLSFTIKPNLYGALAARSLGIPAISNVSGLGTAFIKRNWVTRVVRGLYRAGLHAASKVFFQNQDDLDLFIGEGLVDGAKTVLVPGSGVDIDAFAPMQPNLAADRFRFLLHGRIMWDKGVGEYVEAASRVRKQYPLCEFAVMGFLGVANASAISMSHINEWVRSGAITYLPPADDVRPRIADADCVVLPSYREGTPKALLEAASMAKPVIATDVPGCRQVVEDGRTGFLVKVRDAADLAAKMQRMILLPPAEREAMGWRAREKMVREFDERVVLEAYLRNVAEVARGAAT
jgi:glycosyltransferase involved in cell wall biosynthesis